MVSFTHVNLVFVDYLLTSDIIALCSLLRDVPFSAIYFTAYAHLKKDIFREGENGKTLSFMQTLTAAGIAGASS